MRESEYGYDIMRTDDGKDTEKRADSRRIDYINDLRYRGEHISGLDGLRAFAIIGITLYHLFPVSVQGGYLGVVIFFVLSGFLMAVTSDTGGNTETKLSAVLNFYKERALRIYIPLIPVLLLTGAVLLFAASETLTGKRAEVFSILFGYNNFWQMSQSQSYFDKIMNASPFTHLWYLAIIMQFYIIWPLLLQFINIVYRIRGKYAAAAVMAVISVIMAMVMPLLYSPDGDPTRVYYGTDTRIFSILFGVTAGLIWKSRTLYELPRLKKLKKRLGRDTTLLLALLAFAVLTAVNVAGWAALGGQDPFLYRGGMLLFTLLSVLMIWMASARTLSIGNLLDNPVFKWIGSRSFEIYLWQYPVIYVFNCMGMGSGILQALAETAVIVLLSEWLSRFTGISMKFIGSIHVDNSFFDERSENRKNRFAVSVCALCLCFAVGIYAYESSGDVQSDRSELEAQLQQNAQALAEQKSETDISSGDVSGDNDSEEKNYEDDAVVLKKGAEADGSDVTVIGDSVILGASSAITELMPEIYIDAAQNRQLTQADDIISALKNSGSLRDTVVIALGSNGYFNEQKGQELIDLIGSGRQIYFVNTYGARLDLISWMYDVNDVIKNLAETNINVHVIDWASLAEKSSDWLYSDGMHLKDDGIRAYANLVVSSIVTE